MNSINQLLPHGFCINWTPSLLWLYVISDLAIVVAYYSIPIALTYFAVKRKDLKFRGIFLLFGAFILACGTTHLLGIVVLWNPIYWLDASMKAVTAVISVSTAIILFMFLPKTLRIPTPAQFDKEVAEKLDAFEKLKSAQSSLVNMAQLEESERAKNQLAMSLRATLDAIPDMLFEVGIDGTYYSVHSPKTELIPVSVESLVGSNVKQVLPEAAVSVVMAALREADQSGLSRGAQIELEVPLGRRWFELSVSKKSDGDDASKRFMVLSRDITERKMAEKELTIAAIAFEAQEGILVTDAESKILRVNKAFTEITGYTPEQVLGKTPNILSSGEHNKEFYAAMWKAIGEKGSWEGEVWNRRNNGQIYPERLVINAVKDELGKVSNYVATIADITQTKADSEEIKNLAFYDPLTQLPNRRLLYDRLGQALVSSARTKRYGALLFFDVDNFKILNDTHGHNTGDLLLKLIASRLQSALRAGDTVARIGGDEFVILLEDLDEDTVDAANFVELLGQKILGLLAQPYKLDSHDYLSTVSVGVTLFSGREVSADNLIKQADIAMYQAKSSGKNAIRFFDIQMQKVVEERMLLEKELRLAIEREQFKLYYQIQVDSQKKAIGAEALIRWEHPVHGLILPSRFISLAEDTGLILNIGQWVLENACKQLKKWESNPITAKLALAINMSAKQFNQDSFVKMVEKIIKQYKINPSLLKFEIVESMLLEKLDQMAVKMASLKKLGISFELDDFGTGYSSLQYLKMLPLHQVKIDQSFVRDVEVDGNDKAIVRTIISMGHSLDMKVTAEGVETEAQREFLIQHGCDHFQGYLFGKPMPINDFETLVVANQ